MDGNSELISVSLRRNTSEKPWGFSLIGGIDQHLPVHIQKVLPKFLNLTIVLPILLTRRKKRHLISSNMH